ncbi:MAG: AbfB domain-containing protein [Sedimentisphaerales bacterium]
MCMKKVIVIVLFLCLAGLVQAQDIVIPEDTTALESYDMPGYFLVSTGTNGDCLLVQDGDQTPEGLWNIVEGLAGGDSVSFMPVPLEDHYMRHQNFILNCDPAATDDLFLNDASFIPVPGLADPKGISFESVNYAGRYILYSVNTDGSIAIRLDPVAAGEEGAATWKFPNSFPELASNPVPEDVAIDVPREPILSWKPGKYASAHNVFIGTDFNDVNDATLADPLSATLFEGLDVNNLSPGRLAYDTVYYWRVDEVNAPSSPGTWKGLVWSFTGEEYAPKIPASDITASASGSYGSYNPINTINEVGLDPNHMDLHSNGQPTMWLSNPGAPNSVWVRYDFDKVYKVHQMLVWNYNYPMLLKAGFKDVVVEYSLDGQSWTEVPDVPQFAQGTGSNGYKYNTVVDFDDAIVKSVRIKLLTNWGMTISGLSEVRFTYIPVWARDPEPEDESVGFPWNTTLAWRPGREASQHNVYISTDEQAVIDGTVNPQTVSQASCGPLSLMLTTKYYWRVDEVNNSEAPSLWTGDVWSFTTSDYITIDNFEDYNNTQPYTVWDTWIDGLTDTTYGGSRMGNEYEPFCEEEIVYGGEQSAPLYYNVTSASKSEVVANTSNLKIGSDWTKGSPETLVLWFYGTIDNSADKLYVKLNSSKVYYDGDLLNLTRPAWWAWSISLSQFNVNLANIQTITIGLERAGGTGAESHIDIDEIRLYRAEPPIPAEYVWIEAESGNITAPFETLTQLAGASGGQYIGKANGAGDNTAASPAPDATATYSFTVSGGNYLIGLRVNGYDGSNGVWVRIQGASAIMTVDGEEASLTSGWLDSNNFDGGAFWHWVNVVADDNTDDPEVVYTLEAGTYTLEIANRDDGTMIDAIRIMSAD